MDITASTKFVRMSAKKVRKVVDLVRGLDVAVAEEQLSLLQRFATEPVLKLVHTAVANAEHNFDLVRENLYIKSIVVNGGPSLHRWLPRAFGRATPIQKRSSHIVLVLGEREEGKRGGKARREDERTKHGKGQKHVHAHTSEEQSKEASKEARAKTEDKANTGTTVVSEKTTPSRIASRHDEGHSSGRGFMKKLFNRKAG